MAALNFPASPTNGQIYTSGNRSWIYNTTLGAWEGGIGGGGGITAEQLEAVRARLNLGTTRTAAFTLAAADAGNMLHVMAAADVVLTLPTNAVTPIPVGTVVSFRTTGAGAVVLSPVPISNNATAVPATAGTVMVRHPDGHTRTAKAWGDCFLQKIGTDEWVFSGYTAL